MKENNSFEIIGLIILLALTTFIGYIAITNHGITGEPLGGWLADLVILFSCSILIVLIVRYLAVLWITKK